MARYNSALTSNTITGTATIGSPYSGAFTEFTGTAPYTVTLPTPVAFPGVTQTFYNATSGTVTLSTPSGNFVGTGSTGATTIPIYSGNVVSIVSDGSNYVVISEDGSPLIATTGSFSGNVTINGGSATLSVTPSVVTMAPTASSTIDNIAIGATTRASGAFTTLTSNNAVTLTAGTASSSTTTGTLVVTGGIGASGTIYAGAFNGNLTGTLQTAAQPNITSHGALTSLTVSGFTGLGAAPAHTTGVQWQGFTGALELNGGVGSIGATTNGLYLQGNQFWDGSVGWSAHALGASSQMVLGKGSISANVYASASANANVGSPTAGWSLSNTGFAITGGDLSHSSANPSAGVNFYIKNTTDTGGDNTRYAGIQFQIGSDVGTAAIQAYRTASASDYSTALTFLTKGVGAPATNPVERVRISSLGYVGINTNNPSTMLHVVGSSIIANSTGINPDSYANTVVAGGISFPGGWGVSSGIGGNAGTGNSWALGHNGGGLYFGMGNGVAANTQQTYIQMLTTRNLALVPTSGNVGIGTTNPLAKLHVNAGSGAISIQDYKRIVYNLDASILEGQTYQRFSIGINTTNTTYPRTSGYVRVTVVPNPDGGIGLVYSSVAEFSIWRIDGNNNANFKIISVDNGTIGIATPVASNNSIIFGFTMPNNGTSTTPSFTIRIEIIAADVSNYVITPITTATAHTGTVLSNNKIITPDNVKLVGIGTTTPTARLHIAGTSGGGYSTNNKLILQRTDATNPTGSIEFQGTNGHASPYWNILTDADTTNDFGVAYNGSKMVQILTSGYVGIATTSPGTLFVVQGGLGSDAGGVAGMHVRGNGGGTSCPIYFNDEYTYPQKSIYMESYYLKIRGHNNEGVWILGSNASTAPSVNYKFQGLNSGSTCFNASNVSTWNTTSDRRVKTNIQPLSTSLDKIMQLQPVTFDYTDNFAKERGWWLVDEDGEQTTLNPTRQLNNIGFIAQDYKLVFPADVTISKEKVLDAEYEDFHTLSTDSVLPNLVKAVQELKTLVDDQKKLIEELQDQIKNLS